MSDWQVGDLAVCVDDAPRPYSPKGGFKGLRAGQFYLVRGAQITRSGALNLLFAGHNESGMGWRADRFRKIRPDEHTDCEPEFVTLLKRTKRRVSA